MIIYQRHQEKWVAFAAWLSTFWQQSRAISETGWLPSLPQFCSNEGAVLPKQTGSLEMYLNYLLNPGSLSYLPTNGPVVRRSTLQCHSSAKTPERWAGTTVGKVKSDGWHSGGTDQSCEAQFVSITRQSGWILAERRGLYVFFTLADNSTSVTRVPPVSCCCRVGHPGFWAHSTHKSVIQLHYF